MKIVHLDLSEINWSEHTHGRNLHFKDEAAVNGHSDKIIVETERRNSFCEYKMLLRLVTFSIFNKSLSLV